MLVRQPEALRGNQVLADAVCEPCRVETGRYDRRYLNSIRHLRYALGMGKKRTGRKRKPRPHGTPIRVVRNGAVQELELPYTEHPNAAIFPIFRRAGIITNPTGDAALKTNGDPIVIGYGTDPLDVAKALGASSVQIQQDMPLEQFATTLAKIAFCETVRILTNGIVLEPPVVKQGCQMSRLGACQVSC